MRDFLIENFSRVEIHRSNLIVHLALIMLPLQMNSKSRARLVAMLKSFLLGTRLSMKMLAKNLSLSSGTFRSLQGKNFTLCNAHKVLRKENYAREFYARSFLEDITPVHPVLKWSVALPPLRGSFFPWSPVYLRTNSIRVVLEPANRAFATRIEEPKASFRRVHFEMRMIFLMTFVSSSRPSNGQIFDYARGVRRAC